jgi:hypothetical protein
MSLSLMLAKSDQIREEVADPPICFQP